MKTESVRILAEALDELLRATDGLKLEEWNPTHPLVQPLTVARAAARGALEITDPRATLGARVWCWTCDTAWSEERPDMACPRDRTRLMPGPRPAFITRRVDHGLVGNDRAGYLDGA